MRRSIATHAGRVLFLAAAALCALPGCAARDGAGRVPGPPVLLYVANSGDDTITSLNAANGRAVGRPFPAGPAPWQVVPGPSDAAGTDSLLVLSNPKDVVGEIGLTRLSRSSGRWVTRPVPVGRASRTVWLAGDGGRYGAVAYHDTPGDAEGPGRRCLLALVDHRSGTVVRRHTVCGGPESVAGLALENGPAGPVAYVAIRGPAPLASGQDAARPGTVSRVVAVDGRTGAVVAIRPLAGDPRRLALAAAPGRDAQSLYAVEAPSRWWDEDLPTATGRLLALDAATLVIEREWPLFPLPAALAIAPDGDHAYVLTAHLLTHVDLGTGAQRVLASLPRAAAGLAVTDARVYATDPAGHGVWAVDRHGGHLLQTIPVGRHPVHLALGSAG